MANLIEKWTTHSEFKDYTISNFGEIRCISKNKTLKQSYSIRKNKNGTSVVRACIVHFGCKPFQVHSLVAKFYLPSKPTFEHTIDHIDRDPCNNKSDNLRWATIKEQSINKKNNRKVVIKITIEELDKIYLRTRLESLKYIAKDYKMSASDLCKLLIYLHPMY